jgi:hypothetical protein
LKSARIVLWRENNTARFSTQIAAGLLDPPWLPWKNTQA